MKYVFLILIFTLFIHIVSFGQFTLTVEISGLRNNNGQILFEFSNEKNIKIKGITQIIQNKKCIIIVENLPTGKYAFKYFHDENKNKKMDQNWIGVPIEGYGFSNNATGMFGPPSFNETIFDLKKSSVQKCNIFYIF